MTLDVDIILDAGFYQMKMFNFNTIFSMLYQIKMDRISQFNVRINRLEQEWVERKTLNSETRVHIKLSAGAVVVSSHKTHCMRNSFIFHA